MKKLSGGSGCVSSNTFPLEPTGAVPCVSTMSFPLPVQPYPTRTLDTNEANLLRRFTNTLTAGALHDYDCFVKDCHGDVREDRRHDWKLVKRQNGLAIYCDRSIGANHDNSNAVAPDEDERGFNQDLSAPPGQIQALLCVGTMAGTLDDVMHGVVSPTSEDTMLKSSSIKDNIVDCCVLATIASPTPQDPWRSLTLKWAAHKSPAIVRPFVQTRDFTYAESTGTTTNIDGERVGYHIIHSVVIPDTQKEGHGIVRGNLSLYHVFRQKTPNTVEVHVRAVWQLNGRMHPAVQTYTCVEATISIARLHKCSQMRKLAWMRHKSRSEDRKADPSCCNLCRRWIVGCFAVDKSCSVCQCFVCWRCCVSKTMGTYSPLKREVLEKRQAVCRRCLRKSEENVVLLELKPPKRSRVLLSRALSTGSTASMNSKDWDSGRYCRASSSRYLDESSAKLPGHEDPARPSGHISESFQRSKALP
ncbi:unnamed protein product [Phytophthora lilii]|uniref:Unnamed protein product n=1 Tax=Phytophthora lilii TaxID=2077276 RepID=A0A9W6WFQ4_9STRA|nr:unnamed protein product [Phytophthora lilii]